MIRNKYFEMLENEKIISFYINLNKDASISKKISTDDLSALNDISLIYVYANEQRTEYYIGQTNTLVRRHNEHLREKKGNILKYQNHFGKGTLMVFYGEKIAHNLNYIENSLIKIFKDWEIDHNILTLNSTEGNKSSYFQQSREMVDFDVIESILKSLVQNRMLKFSPNISKDSLKAILYRNSPFFELYENQKRVMKDILTGSEDIFIIRGGAGTGKTVLLNNIVAKLIKENNRNLDSKNKTLKIGVCFKNNMLKSFAGIFRSYEPDLGRYKVKIENYLDLIRRIYNKKYDYIFVDEAHRLLQYDDDLFPKASRIFLENYNCENVLNLLMRHSKKLVLFYDDKQSIRKTDIEDIGTKGNYSSTYNFSGKKIYDETLKLQYRIRPLSFQRETDIECANGFIIYIKYMLQQKNLSELGNLEFLQTDYFGICDSLKELKDYYNDKTRKFPFKRTAIIAGLSRKHDKKGNEQKGELAWKEIEMGLNKNNEKWATSGDFSKEVGTIHSVQGYDFDYVGVIVGKDLIYQNNKVSIDRDNYFDNKGKKGCDDEMLEKFIKNIYYTLLTRGIYGIRIYIEDDALREYWKKKTEELRKYTK